MERPKKTEWKNDDEFYAKKLDTIFDKHLNSANWNMVNPTNSQPVTLKDVIKETREAFPSKDWIDVLKAVAVYIDSRLQLSKDEFNSTLVDFFAKMQETYNLASEFEQYADYLEDELEQAKKELALYERRDMNKDVVQQISELRSIVEILVKKTVAVDEVRKTEPVAEKVVHGVIENKKEKTVVDEKPGMFAEDFK